MNAEQLLAHYERIAEAPDAIALLRRFVLNLAVCGKLVERNAADAPASEIVEQLQELKFEQSVRGLANAIKTPRDTLPFSPPDHWQWARLISFSRASYGFAFASGRFNSDQVGMPLIRIRDISRSDTEAYFDGEYDPFYLVRAGDYLIGMDGDFNLRRWGGKDALLNQRVLRLNDWQGSIDPEYVRIPLQMVLDCLHGNTSQTTVKHLSAKQVNGIEIPLPPLAEQHRIVAKVDELLALCDRLEEARKEREAARDRLTAASLARLNTPDPDPATFTTHARFALDNFPALTTRADRIKQLRQTILNLAVRGKLVGQDEADEPANELLMQILQLREQIISTNKVRKKRPNVSSGGEGEVSLPTGWTATPLQNLTDPMATLSYGVLVPGPDVENGIPFVRAQDLMLTKHPEKPAKTIAQEIEAPYAKTRLRGGEILLCVVGSIGKLGVVPPTWVGANIARAVVRIAPIQLISSAYLLLFLQSDLAQNFFLDVTRTLAQPTLNVGLLEKLPVSIPPRAEQHRIVAKVANSWRCATDWKPTSPPATKPASACSKPSCTKRSNRLTREN